MAAEWRGDDIDEESVIEPEEGGDDAVAKIKKLQEELKTCRTEKQEYMDGWQRAKADYVNLLKRGSEELKAAEHKGVSRAVETLFPAFDALERAKEHVPSEALAKEGGEMIAGFMAIAKQLEAAFAALGLEATGVVGEPFDPVSHDAIGTDPAKDGVADDTVSAVLETGWKIGDAVIRPAKVRVAHKE